MDTPNNAAPAATDDAHPEPVVARPAAAAVAPGDRLVAQLAGDTPAAMIDALHQKHFAGSKLTTDTEAWNLLHDFVADIKRLWAELEEAAKKL